MDGTSPRRTASFTSHMRAMSLDSAADTNYTRSSQPVDPFDAEWATARQNAKSTNPFLNSNTTPHAFQVQL